MTSAMKITSWGSMYTDSLAKGCKQCIEGAKLVVLVTTDCTSNCFYCPLSIERKASPYSFANERPIKRIDDLILEASLMDATGASMTGGDPLEQHSFSHTLEYCKVLRENNPKDFHIHLYTRGKEISRRILLEITPYIDEIRFHVINPKNDFTQVKLAIQFEVDVGIEVPIIPTKGIDYYCDLINQFASILPETDHFYFMNLNELEVSETNYRNLLAHGLRCDHKNPSAIEGSADLGKKIVKWASNAVSVPVHFCSLATKDSVQLPNRLYRIAKAVKLPSDVVIPNGPDKGLLIRGIIQAPSTDLNHIRRVLLSRFQIPENLIHVEKDRLLTNAAILDELKDQIKVLFPDVILGITEEYPTYDRLRTTWTRL